MVNLLSLNGKYVRDLFCKDRVLVAVLIEVRQ